MKRFSHTIKNPLGIHARVAGILVKEAAKHRSSITLEKDGKTVDAKRVLAVMGLGVKSGQTVGITVQGPDEEEAARAFEKFVKANL